MFRRAKSSSRVNGLSSSTRSVSSVTVDRTNVKNVKGRPRSQSLPSGRHDVKGIMKFATADESIHSKYGSETTREGSDVSADETRKVKVVLKDIHIREYNRTIGDNPSCSSGPPISIDWQYDPETKIITVDQYETTRPPRRSNFEMVLPRDIRQSMLKKEWDVSQGQIAAAVRANIKVKNQRRSTVNNLGKATRMEEMMESAGKKVFGGLMFKKSTNRQVQELEQQVEDAQKLRSQAKLEMQMSGEYDDVDSEMNEDKSTQSTIGDA